jgi:hypothetical protein
MKYTQIYIARARGRRKKKGRGRVFATGPFEASSSSIQPQPFLLTKATRQACFPHFTSSFLSSVSLAEWISFGQRSSAEYMMKQWRFSWSIGLWSDGMRFFPEISGCWQVLFHGSSTWLTVLIDDWIVQMTDLSADPNWVGLLGHTFMGSLSIPRYASL